MNEHHDDQPTVDYGTVLRDVWDTPNESTVDEDCSPTKVCRNARDFTFEGISDGDEDLATAWKNLLRREGKHAPEGESIRDLVLGTETD